MNNQPALSAILKTGHIGSLTFVKILSALLLCCLIWQPLKAQAASDGQDPISLPDLVRKTMAQYFSQKADQPFSADRLAKAHPLSAPYRKPAGVFVTLSRQGKPRACWGSIFPEQRDVIHSTIYATLGALTKEYRYPPIRQSEWQTLKPQVTLVREVLPLHNLAHINPLRDGLMVRSGSKSGVILPGEARDAKYQLQLCKLKAGIKAGEPFQMYRIKADVFQ